MQPLPTLSKTLFKIAELFYKKRLCLLYLIRLQILLQALCLQIVIQLFCVFHPQDRYLYTQ